MNESAADHPLRVLMLADSSSFNSPSLWVNGTQLIPWLAAHGCTLSIPEAFSRPVARAVSAVPGIRRVFWKGLLPKIRAQQLDRFFSTADVVIVHKSITHIQDEPVLERRLRQLHNGIIFNFDDATHERGIPYLDERLSLADAAWVGNPLLLDFARQHCPRVELIESAVDCDHYFPKTDYRIGSLLRLCWSGTPSSYPYLDLLREPLRRLGRVIPYQMTVMSRTPFTFSDPAINDKWLPFSHAGELRLLRESDVGLMPLPDGPYERAKENYKTKIYLASALPVVASPTGMNTRFLINGERGMFAATTDEWVDGICGFAASESKRQDHGQGGREFIEKNYAIPAIGSKLLKLFGSVRNGLPRLHSRDATSQWGLLL